MHESASIVFSGLLVVLLLGVSPIAGECRGATYYLDAVNGDDGTAGTSNSPWRTLARAQSAVQVGDVVLLRDGSYGVFSEAKDHAGWITYKADSGHNPVFSNIELGAYPDYHNHYLHFEGITLERGSYWRDQLVWLYHASYVKLINLTFIGKGYTQEDKSTAINLATCSNITMDGLRIYGLAGGPMSGYEFGINSTYSSNVTVNNCDIANCRKSIVAWGDSWTITNNHIHDGDGDGILGTGIANTDIVNNHIHDIIAPPGSGDHCDGIQFYNPNASPSVFVHIENVTISRNRIYNINPAAAAQGIWFGGFGPSGSGDIAENIVVENNLIYKCGQYTVDRVFGPSAVNGLVIRNNIFDGVVDIRDQCSNVTLAGNIMYRCDAYQKDKGVPDPVYDDYNIVRQWWIHWNDYYVRGIHSVEMASDVAYQALFADYAGGDLRPASGSIAVDFMPLAVAAAVDLDGNPRVDIPGMGKEGSDYADAGCYEYDSTGPLNSPPVLDPIGDKTVAKQSSLVFTVTASDADGDAITYSTPALPAGAAFINQTFNWTPDSDQIGTYQVTFTVSDGQAQDFETIDIMVTNINQPPALLTIGDKSVDEDGTLSFTVNASDPDGGAITYSAQPLPMGAAFGNQTFSWTPDYEQAGVYQITFTASDGAAEDSETITITVINTNRPPVLLAIGGKSVGENGSLGFAISASDPDGDAITYSAQLLPTGAAFGNQTFSWMPDYEQAGAYQVTFTASDGVAEDSETITITVTNTNRAPVLLAIGDKSVGENGSLGFTISASDPDGDAITYSTPALPAGAAFINQAFSWAPDFGQVGTYQVTFTVSDGQAQDSETISITVTNTNQPPQLQPIGGKFVGENGTLIFAVSASDPDGDAITYSAQPVPAGAAFGGQSFGWTPGYEQAGVYQVTFTASDGVAGDSETILITVANTNRAPVLTVIGDKSVSATDSLSFSVSATDADGDSLTYSTGGLPEGATFGGQSFNWVPAEGQAGSYQITFAVSDGLDQDLETITVSVNGSDTAAPVVTGFSPAPGSIQIPLNTLITLHITDSGSGVDGGLIQIKVSNDIVYSGDTSSYESAYGRCYRMGTAADYTFTYQPYENFAYNRKVRVAVSASDLSGNVMDVYSYRFRTEMRSFGRNKKVSSAPALTAAGSSSTVSDGSGDIWAVWHSGPAGAGDIYVARRPGSAEYFGSSFRLTEHPADQRNPAMATDGSKLYVVWQDNRRGNWDIFLSTSADGLNWTSERLVTDSNDNQTNPALVIDHSAVPKAYIFWQDDGSGNQDIYIASSSDGFISKAVRQVTSDVSDQSEPAVAVAADNTVYVVWTDKRGGSSDIYGAASNYGPWTNVAVVDKAFDQSSPSIAAEQAGSVIHLAWVDDSAGNKDIYYAASNSLPAGALNGASIIDDSSGAEQIEPVITACGSGADLAVFVAWRDRRNAAAGDMDLYFAEVSSEVPTNIFVGDDGTNSNQSEPAVGIDSHGQPYVVWTDDRAEQANIYFAGSTFVDGELLHSADVSAATAVTVGPLPAAITGSDDISAFIPVSAFGCDVKVSLCKVQNPPRLAVDRFSGLYEFGPSGIRFAQPVTITIPYEVSGSSGVVTAYWYDPLTAGVSQEGISEVERLVISPTLHAIRFKTTHFTSFLIGAAAITAAVGGGGGGCSLSQYSDGSVAELLLPYLVLAAAMAVIKLRDLRNRRTKDMSKGR